MTDPTPAAIGSELRLITTYYGELFTEATYRAHDRESPGGDALMLLGPAANLEAWEHRYETTERNHDDDPEATKYVDDQLDTESHPLLVLATYEDIIRDLKGQPTDLRATVYRAADYLRNNIDWMFSTDFTQVANLAKDLRAVRLALENVLHEGIRPDRGAPCMRCNSDLIKIWGNEDPNTDRWHCGPCNEYSTLEQYGLALRADYLRNAEVLNAADMETQYRIKGGTLRSWASRGSVTRCGTDDKGRVLYHVGEALAIRDLLIA